jgi:two-component system, OmpR family, sensor kinase
VRLPIRTRLTLVFAVLSAALFGAAAVALVLGFRAVLLGAVDDRLRTRLAELEDDPRAVASSGTSEEEFAQFVESDGSLLVGPGPTERLLPPGVTSGVHELRFFSMDVAVDTPEEVVPARILAAPAGDGVLMVGVDVEDQAEAAARLLAIVVIGGPILVGVLAALGWVLAAAALRPVERLRSEAAALHVSEPSRRLAVPETGDELQRLAKTLNGMLDRVHEALERERRLVDEASHELRTPLGLVQAELDLALREPRTSEELEAALRSISEEMERLRRLTEDLLVLARSDRGRIPVHRTDVDVSDILERVAAEFGERAARAGVRILVSGSLVRARLDGDRVRQAVENLVANAIRHAGRGGVVEVWAERDAETLRIVVLDPGSGFADDVLDRAFEPFARADDDRASDGAGLGLAIVRAVAEAHGGSASARNLEGGGAEVSVHMPI